MHKRYDGARTQGKKSVKLVYKHPTKRSITHQTMIYKTLHKKLRIEQQELHLRPVMNSGDSEG